jgi:hypothetical protein
MSTVKNAITAKNLTKQAPTSPRKRTGGYAILSRLSVYLRSELFESIFII